MTPGHRTVQEGLSMVSCREAITKSMHVLYWKPFYSEFFTLEGFVKACPVGLTDSYKQTKHV